MYRAIFDTIVGRLFIVGTKEAVHSLGWTDEEESNLGELEPFVMEIRRALHENDDFNVNIEFLTGTVLQRRVWNEIRNIDFGERITYKELALRVGSPRAVRAVASACGKNPIALIVPCHRVVRNDGSLGEYRWGAETKEMLLKMEE
jgi:O-6-methylguanine DNA methyltransferase